MNLFALLQRRLDAGQPVSVALVGAGKFGSMFLSQVPTTPGLEVVGSPSGAEIGGAFGGEKEDQPARAQLI